MIPVPLRRAPWPQGCLVEAFVMLIAVIATFWLGWVALWLIEQRW